MKIITEARVALPLFHIQEVVMSKKNKVIEIVLTGGPCSGKTTMLAYLFEKVSNWGYRVFIAPETATEFMSTGIANLSEIEKDDFYTYLQIEKLMLIEQAWKRKSYLRRAALFPEERRVIFYDRAEADISAYMPRRNFEKILRSVKLGWRDARDSYDGVIHLVSAACGAEKFYTIENNKARRENIIEARIADERTQQAWNGHPHLKIIDNSTGFEEKLNRAIQAVARILGVPVPLTIERKFLLRHRPDFNNPLLMQPVPILIEQIYLVANKIEEIRIRKRCLRREDPVYYRTHRIKIGYGRRQETEEMISVKEYNQLKLFRDPSKRVIKKRRYCFIHNNQYFELDIFPADIFRNYELCLLEIKLTEENDKVEVPSFLNVSKEVTGDERYTNAQLASLCFSK